MFRCTQIASIVFFIISVGVFGCGGDKGTGPSDESMETWRVELTAYSQNCPDYPEFNFSRVETVSFSIDPSEEDTIPNMAFTLQIPNDPCFTEQPEIVVSSETLSVSENSYELVKTITWWMSFYDVPDCSDTPPCTVTYSAHGTRIGPGFTRNAYWTKNSSLQAAITAILQRASFLRESSLLPGEVMNGSRFGQGCRVKKGSDYFATHWHTSQGSNPG